MQKEDNKVIQYLERNPMITIVVLISFTYVLHTFLTRNQEVEMLKYSLVNTSSYDVFTDKCEYYFNTRGDMSSSSLTTICKDLSYVVDKSNKEAIYHAYEQERKDYEDYKNNRDCDPIRGC